MGPSQRRSKFPEQFYLRIYIFLFGFRKAVPPLPEFIGEFNLPFHMMNITNKE